MCGRYRLSRRKQAIEEYFAMQPGDVEWEAPLQHWAEPISPDDSASTRRCNTQNVADAMGSHTVMVESTVRRGGLINARSETAASKPAFRDALKLRRCLIPADAFYEWQKISKGKQPFCFEMGDGEVLALAGLWDEWKSANGEMVVSCSILTTTPNSTTVDIHNRMPVIIRQDDYDLWLDPKMRSLRAISEPFKAV